MVRCSDLIRSDVHVHRMTCRSTEDQSKVTPSPSLSPHLNKILTIRFSVTMSNRVATFSRIRSRARMAQGDLIQSGINIIYLPVVLVQTATKALRLLTQSCVDHIALEDELQYNPYGTPFTPDFETTSGNLTDNRDDMHSDSTGPTIPVFVTSVPRRPSFEIESI